MDDMIRLESLEFIPPDPYVEFDFKGQKILVRQYLSTNEKLDLIADILSRLGTNPYAFVNPVQMDVYISLGIVAYYTNIDIGDAVDNAPGAAYDVLYQTRLLEQIKSHMRESELNSIVEGTWDTVNAYYRYRNSAKGILEDITTDYKNLDLDATAIQQKLAEGEGVTFLKEVMDKMG